MFSGPAENDAGPSPAKARISMTPGCLLWVITGSSYTPVLGWRSLGTFGVGT